jgi:hypothetical protein
MRYKMLTSELLMMRIADTINDAPLQESVKKRALRLWSKLPVGTSISIVTAALLIRIAELEADD